MDFVKIIVSIFFKYAVIIVIDSGMGAHNRAAVVNVIASVVVVKLVIV